jgi:hypothetical protein
MGRMDDWQRERAARMTVRRYDSARDADRDDLPYWRQMSDAERVLHTWRLRRGTLAREG